MAVFYEFKISVADKDDIKSSEKLDEMGIKVEPEWRDSLCMINLDEVEGFYPYNKTETKVLFRNDNVIVFCKYEDLKEIFRKHYGVYPEEPGNPHWTENEVKKIKERTK